MFNRKLFGYSVSLRRKLPECEHYDLLEKKFYVHKADLTKLVMNPVFKTKLNLIFDQIKSKQPAGLSDDGLKEYFDREMKKRGFREMEFSGLMGIEANHSYLYSSEK
jgi:hypothetical protein